jgi:hypothetical protein
LKRRKGRKGAGVEREEGEMTMGRCSEASREKEEKKAVSVWNTRKRGK